MRIYLDLYYVFRMSTRAGSPSLTSISHTLLSLETEETSFLLPISNELIMFTLLYT